MIVDEGASAPAHRFLSFLRLLLDVHPRVGAASYARWLGLHDDLRVGWNAIRRADDRGVAYVDVAPGSGRLTDDRPDVPDDDIQVVDENAIPLLEGSLAWRQTLALAEALEKNPVPGLTSEWMRGRLEFVAAQATTPLRGEDPGVDERIAQTFQRIRGGVDGGAGLDVFESPIREVLDDYLDFRLTRRQASNIIAALLASFAIRFPSPIDRSGGAAPALAQIDYLISLASTAARHRQNFDLGSFGCLTRVGLLWADVAVLMGKELAKRSTGKTLVDKLKAYARYADELAAHELSPSLLHPASLVPFGVVEYQCASTRGIVDPKGMYVGAGAVGQGPVSPEDIWPRIQEYSASKKRLDPSTDRVVRGFLSVEIIEHLNMFLLTMKLGRNVGN